MSQEEFDPEMIERAVFGEQVHNFMNTDVGKYIQRRAADQISEAVKELRECDPDNAGKVREYQNRADVAEHVVQWLQDAILDGLKALQIIESRE